MTQETRHTPEPWRVKFAHGTSDVYDKEGELIALVYPTEGPENAANAARIVACVNACKGMADPAAEIAALRARVAELEKEAGHE